MGTRAPWAVCVQSSGRALAVTRLVFKSLEKILVTGQRFCPISGHKVLNLVTVGRRHILCTRRTDGQVAVLFALIRWTRE